MTFTPIPKDELRAVDDLFLDLVDTIQEITSRLHYAEQAANWAAVQITTLFASLPDVVDDEWDYAGDIASGGVGPGQVAIHVNADQSRSWALSKENSDYDLVDLGDLKQGSTIVLTDDPGSPPVTAFRQYTVTDDPIDRGAWVSFPSVRIATFGVLSTPGIGSSVRLILR
jgi:hypothetical protein